MTTVEDPFTVPNLTSIQGELLEEDPTRWVMDQADVDEYVDRQTPEVLECRERGRHTYPLMLVADPEDLHFTDVDEDTGLFIRKVYCTICKLAYRRERWRGVETSRGRAYWEPVDASVSYETGPNGETYLAPSGKGSMRSKQVRRSIATKKMSGMTPAKMRKRIERANKKRPAASADLASVG